MKQQRNSRQRRLVLEAVRNHTDHPSADRIYLDVRLRDDKISRGTVYRNLNLLAANGKISRVETPGMDRFDLRTEPHYHLMCVGCGKITDAALPYQTEWDREVGAQAGYTVHTHSVLFEGLCPDCAKKDEKERGAPRE
ncbi:Fur family transcriptional regulator [Christensenella tenuis]|jgi:Fur family transcriptional regulator, ferric uptake regulator|uniref:Transcriptional repressor n=1 Tax=Christensenella tenuis TaxID=2763033 RepID=A0ABR7EFD5_9FIRM|nr:transcriptional repressor [Christensenella tenuis]MBC5648368.1 transcriptional repressor [Christensenella tenuis]